MVDVAGGEAENIFRSHSVHYVLCGIIDGIRILNTLECMCRLPNNNKKMLILFSEAGTDYNISYLFKNGNAFAFGFFFSGYMFSVEKAFSSKLPSTDNQIWCSQHTHTHTQNNKWKKAIIRRTRENWKKRDRKDSIECIGALSTRI